MMNKKGGEKLISIWWFMVLMIVATGIVISVSAYYSSEVEVKTLEAEVLSEKVLDCMNNNGVVPGSFFKEGFDVLKECDFSSKAFESGSNFYFKVALYKGDMQLKEVHAGDAAFEESCRVAEQVTARDFPRCVSKNESVNYVADGLIESGELRVIAGSNQYGRRTIISL